MVTRRYYKYFNEMTFDDNLVSVLNASTRRCAMYIFRPIPRKRNESRRELPRVMHIIKYETLGETLSEREKSRQESRRVSNEESSRDSLQDSR